VNKDDQDVHVHPSVHDGAVSLKNVTKKFGKNVVLDDISLTIEKGKTTVIIGPSGCGKTVLIKLMIVLLRPTAGEVLLGDKRIDDLPDYELNRVRTRFGFLFQSGALFDSLTVAENVMFPIIQHGGIADWDMVDEIVKTKLAMVGLDGFQDYYPDKLSGGQRKRVALARAIALNPEVILYDEPTTGLDPIRADVINDLIIKTKNGLGITSVAVTHDMTSAYKIANRIIMLHSGKIIADGDADHIRNHTNPVVQRFLHGEVNKEDLTVMGEINSDGNAKE